MKILVIDEEFPWPLDSGKRIRSFNLISRLAPKHEVCYLAYGESGSESFNHLKQPGITPLTVPRQAPRKSGLLFYVRLLQNLFSSWPYIVSSHYSRVFHHALREEVEKRRPDLLLCEWSPYAVFLKDLPGPKKLIVAHNIEHRIWRRYYDNESNPIKRWYIGLQMRKLERFEGQAFAWADAATAVSESEAEIIRSFVPGMPVSVIENGVDLDYFAPQPYPVNSSRLVFVGALDWRPNQDAVRYFVSDILPVLNGMGIQIEIDLIGSNPPPDLIALSRRPGVNLVGHVPDVRPFVARAGVYVVPLRIGGGTRLKILEALAMKKAVVATPVGAEGLDVSDGENIMLADTPELFADKIKQLLKDSELARRLGENGRRLVEESYGWDYLADKLDKEITHLVRTE